MAVAGDSRDLIATCDSDGEPAKALLVNGWPQRQDRVIHVPANRLRDLCGLLAGLSVTSRDFQ